MPIKLKSKKEIQNQKIIQQDIKKSPELYVKINIINKDNGMIETFYTFAKDRNFKHNGKKYKLKPEGMNLIPLKNSFMPFYVFKENETTPYNFKNQNQRVPARVLTLLYNLDTYRILIQMEFKKLNFILVILGIITLILLIIYGYCNFTDLPIPYLRG